MAREKMDDLHVSLLARLRRKNWADRCGRFALGVTYRELANDFVLSGDLALSPSSNITPASQIPAITADREGSRYSGRMK